MFKFKKIDTKLAETTVGTKARPGVVTLNKDTIAYVENKDGAPTIELVFKGTQVVDGKSKEVLGTIFGLRVDPKFKSGETNFKFAAIEKLRLVSNWNEAVTYTEVDKKTRAKTVRAYKADIDFTGVQIIVTNEYNIYKGEEDSKFRLISAGKNGVTPDGAKVEDVDCREIIPKPVHLFRQAKVKVGNNTSGQVDTTAQNTDTDTVPPWAQGN